jgi:PAS domain S-box-containing protein
MIELKNYDDAVYRFRKTLNFTPLPVNAWDFYGLHFDNRCKASEDVIGLSKLALQNNWKIADDLFTEALENKEQVIVVTDASLNIVYATQNIWQMNRYRPEEIMGLKPKIFQGKKTDQATLKKISSAVRDQRAFEEHILNYRKDGETYNCWIKGQPVFNEQGTLVNFIAFEKEVA